jgi:hypothetical protein
MLEQVRGAASPAAAASAHPAPSTWPSAGSSAVPAADPLVPAAVMGVALIGAGAIMDGDLREALFGGTTGAGASAGGGGGCGTDSGGSGSGSSCGGGGGGCGSGCGGGGGCGGCGG